MITERTHTNVTWVDVVSPTQKEVRTLMDDYTLPPEVGEALLSPSLKAKIRFFKDMIFVVLHFPVIASTDSNEFNQEVDFVITKKHIITVRYDAIESLRVFAKRLEVGDVVQHTKRRSYNAGLLFYHMMHELIHELDHELEGIDLELGEIEEHIFAGKEQAMVHAVSEVARTLLDTKHTLEEQYEVLEVLALEGTKVCGKQLTDELNDIFERYKRMMVTITHQQEFLQELRVTNDSLLSTKQNQVMKTLTILAFVTFPLSLIATIFGMNTRHTPIIGHVYDFWILVGIMVVLTFLMFAWFKENDWF